MLNSTSDTGNPPTSPTSNLSSLYGKAWSDLSALTYRDISIGGSYPGTTLFRGQQKDDAGSYNEITDFMTTGFAERDEGAAPGLPYSSIVTPHSASDRVWPPKPTPSGFFLPYHGQWEHGGVCQSSFWIWRPDILQLGSGHVVGLSKVDLETWRSRAKFNRISSHTFVGTAEIWTEKLDGSVGWDNFSTRQCNSFRYDNATLLVSDFSQATDTWYEVPEVSDDTSAGSFSSGFIGRVNFAVWFESPSDWESRTGITLL